MSGSTSAINEGAPQAGASSQTDAPIADTALNPILAEGVAEADALAARVATGSGAGTLQLADLLQVEHDGNLDALLTFSSDGTNTTIHVSAGGRSTNAGTGDRPPGRRRFDRRRRTQCERHHW
jgi:hypothetical protein